MPHVDDVDPVLLTAVLDRLLPAHDELAGAGTMGLGQMVVAGAGEAPHLDEPATAVIQALPDDFTDADADTQDARLRAAESADPDRFAALVNLAYNAYYTDGRVLAAVEARTGYSARPPQPEGYQMEPFDESILATIRQRAPLWRQV